MDPIMHNHFFSAEQFLTVYSHSPTIQTLDVCVTSNGFSIFRTRDGATKTVRLK